MKTYVKSFAAGEICPALYGRVDLTKYATGVRTMRNFFVAKHGGAYNRAGTSFRAKAYDSTHRIRLIRFNSQTGIKYLLEFGHLYVRILMGGRPVRVTPKTITVITKSSGAGQNTTVQTLAPHGFNPGETVTFSGVTGTTTFNGKSGFIVATGMTATSFQVNLDSSGYSGNGFNGTATVQNTGIDPARTPSNIASLVKGTTTTVTTTTPHQLAVGDTFQLSGIGGATGLNGQILTVQSVTSPTTVVSSFDSSGYAGTPTDGQVQATIAREIVVTTKYTEAMLRELNFAQDGNSLIIVHQQVYPQTLAYNGQDSWTFSQTSTSPNISAPTNLATSAALGTAFYFGVTAVNSETFEESFVSTIGVNTAPASNAPIGISWTAVPGAVQYNIYVGTTQQTLGFRTIVYTNGFSDNGTLFIDYTNPPPIPRPLFQDYVGTATPPYGSLPGAVGYFQQRRFFGNLGPVPEYPPIVPPPIAQNADRIFASRIGSPTYFAIKRPTGDDDSISFRMLSREPQIIRHFLDIGKLAVFTEQGEWIIAGGPDGAITPSTINPTNVSQNGTGFIRPLSIGNVGLYVQRKGKIVRTFGYEFQIEGYRGDDLTIFATHLTKDSAIVSWDLVKLPHPIIWSVRDDGQLLGLTFVPEQAIFAWHRHDFAGGFVEDVCQNDDRLYLVIRRTVNGQTVRYIERMTLRDFASIKDAVFMDASTTYFGDKFDGSTVTLSGGTTWDNGDTVTATCSAGNFSAMTAAVHVTAPDGTFIRLTGLSYVSPTVVTGTPEKLIPPAMRGVAITNWQDARNVVTGLQHLEGMAVSVVGDGFVVANPNNDDYDLVTVVNGQVSLGDVAYGRIHVGLPIVADLETLNIDTAQGESILDRKKLITKVSAWVEGTRGVWAGGSPPDDDSQDPREGLTTGFNELKARYDEGYDAPNNLVTRVIEINLEAQWNSHGRVFIRQIDPLPVGLLSIAPTGLIPFSGG